MNKIAGIFLFLFGTLSLLAGTVTDNNKFRISGKVEGLDNEQVSFRLPSSTSPNGYEVVKINFKNGKIDYTAEISEPTVIRAWIYSPKLMKTVNGGYIPTKSSQLIFVAYPGADIKIKGKVSDFFDAYPYDNSENDIMADLNKSLYPVMNKKVNLMLDKEKKQNIDEKTKKQYDLEIEKLGKSENEIRLKFLEDNISSVVALWLMEDMIIRSQIDMDKVLTLLKRVDSKYNSNTYYKNLKARADGYLKTKPGRMISLKTNNTLTGRMFDLAELKGKYVILDFWGTWCGACCMGMPHLYDFRNKYKKDLEVVAVNCGDSVERWKNSKYTKDYDWIHIKSEKSGEDNFVNMFNVQGYPTKILLDKEGKILFRVVGEKPSFYEKIETLIK